MNYFYNFTEMPKWTWKSLFLKMTVSTVTEVWAGLFGVVERQWRQVVVGGDSLPSPPLQDFPMLLPSSLEALQLAYLGKGLGSPSLLKSFSDLSIPLRTRDSSSCREFAHTFLK